MTDEPRAENPSEAETSEEGVLPKTISPNYTVNKQMPGLPDVDLESSTKWSRHNYFSKSLRVIFWPL